MPIINFPSNRNRVQLPSITRDFNIKLPLGGTFLNVSLNHTLPQTERNIQSTQEIEYEVTAFNPPPSVSNAHCSDTENINQFSQRIDNETQNHDLIHRFLIHQY